MPRGPLSLLLRRTFVRLADNRFLRLNAEHSPVTFDHPSRPKVGCVNASKNLLFPPFCLTGDAGLGRLDVLLVCGGYFANLKNGRGSWRLE